MSDNDLSGSSVTTQVVVDRPICGFWRRVLAFFIDNIILLALGSLLGLLFFEQLSQLGSMGRLLGFLIATSYFGVLDSKLMNGQSFGKRILKIRVVNKDGVLIDLKTSFLRASLPSILICSNGASFNNPELLGRFIVFLVSALAIGMIYFYIFNTRTRQSLHDIMCGTYVYRADATGMSTDLAVARVHYITYLLILVIVGIGNLYGQKLPLMSDLQVLDSVYKEVRGLDGAYEAAVNLNRFKNGNQETKSLKVTIYASNKPMQNDTMWDNAARIVLEKYPEVYSLQRIDVNIMHGYNIGIASGWTNRIVVNSPVEWKEKLHILQLPNEKPLPSVLNKIVIEKIIKDIKSVYNTGDNKALYTMMGDYAKTNLPYADFEKGASKMREVGKMNNAVYSHYTHFQQKEGSDLFALFYAVDYEVGKGYARVVIMPGDGDNWQIIGLWTNIEK